jgi:hypothetical protein
MGDSRFIRPVFGLVKSRVNSTGSPGTEVESPRKSANPDVLVASETDNLSSFYSLIRLDFKLSDISVLEKGTNGAISLEDDNVAGVIQIPNEIASVKTVFSFASEYNNAISSGPNGFFGRCAPLISGFDSEWLFELYVRTKGKVICVSHGSPK